MGHERTKERMAIIVRLTSCNSTIVTMQDLAPTLEQDVYLVLTAAGRRFYRVAATESGKVIDAGCTALLR